MNTIYCFINTILYGHKAFHAIQKWCNRKMSHNIMVGKDIHQHSTVFQLVNCNWPLLERWSHHSIYGPLGRVMSHRYTIIGPQNWRPLLWLAVWASLLSTLPSFYHTLGKWWRAYLCLQKEEYMVLLYETCTYLIYIHQLYIT